MKQKSDSVNSSSKQLCTLAREMVVNRYDHRLTQTLAFCLLSQCSVTALSGLIRDGCGCNEERTAWSVGLVYKPNNVVANTWVTRRRHTLSSHSAASWTEGHGVSSSTGKR